MSLPVEPTVVAVRLGGFGAASLRTNAEGTHNEDSTAGLTSPRYGVSVLADSCHDGESREDAVARICQSTSLTSKNVAYAELDEIEAEGFSLIADPIEEQPMHHLLGQGPLTAPPDCGALESLFSRHRMPNPTYPGRTR